MRNTKPEKSIKRGLVTKGFLVLLSLIILIFIASFAWFYSKINEASASGIQVKTSGNASFEYAVGFYNSDTGQVYTVSDWFDDKSDMADLKHIPVTVNNEKTTYDLLKDYEPIDITGDGSTLIKPAMTYMNKEVDQDSNNFSYANPNVQYITFDLIFRAPSPGTIIALDDGCWVKGNWETLGENNSLVSSDSTIISNKDFNVSTYAKINDSVTNPTYNTAFSKDAIAGAVRMSFVNFNQLTFTNSSDRFYVLNNTDKLTDSSLYNDNCSNRPAVLWNPRPELCLNPDADDSTSNWTLSLDKTSSNTDGFSYSNDGSTTVRTSTFDHTFYQIFDGRNNAAGPHTFNTIHPGDIEYNLVNDPSGKTIATIGTTAIDGKYYGKVKVNVWVDGCDKEARRALSGGKFLFHLALKGSNNTQ